MKILCACEESQAVTKEFRALGHETYSCDILPCSGGHPEWHLQQDVTELLQQEWDMIIAFPPCTYLSSSGMHWTVRGIRPQSLTDDALEFAGLFFNHPCQKIAIENPIGILSKNFRKPEQIIQPWMFGHDASKQTCLWLKGLPLLQPTKIVPPSGWEHIRGAGDMAACECCEEPFCQECGQHYEDCACLGPFEAKGVKTINGIAFGTRSSEKPKPVWGNQTPSGQNKLGPSADRARLRSKTYEGIAKAMADQWGKQ